MTPDNKQPTCRAGPTPLPAHVMMAAGNGLAALAAFTGYCQGGQKWHPELEAEAQELRRDIAKLGEGRVAAALMAEAQERLNRFLTGIEAYQHHDYRRDVTAPQVIASHGSAQLFDFGGEAGSIPAVFVPSLVNPSWVLDLSKQRSLMRYLAKNGIRPLLLDWGSPDDKERTFGLEEYIGQRLLPLMAAAQDQVKRPFALVGYCMGGNLALAAALSAPQMISGLALLATPWDFHAAGPSQPQLIRNFAAMAEPIMHASGLLPGEWLQLAFAALDPSLAENKFSRFAGLDPHSRAAQDFVALEDWANSGPPLAAPVARQVFSEWYGENRPGTGDWHVGGLLVQPEDIACPSFLAVANADRIVPPASSMALAQGLRNPHLLELPLGHVGMIVSSRAEKLLWRPLRDWLAGLDGKRR